jgi:hypothetical protein
MGRQIEEMIEKYAIGKLQIAKDRIYNKLEQGGGRTSEIKRT